MHLTWRAIRRKLKRSNIANKRNAGLSFPQPSAYLLLPSYEIPSFFLLLALCATTRFLLPPASADTLPDPTTKKNVPPVAWSRRMI